MLDRIQSIFVKGVGIGVVSSFTLGVSTLSAGAAENVVLKYGIFSRSVPVESLTNFAETGQASGGIEAFLGSIPTDDRPAIVKLLDTKLPFGVLQVDQILQSPTGEQFLNDLASATILPGDSEVKALRSAAILSAAEDKSLSFSSMLRKYPTQTLTVDLPKLLKTLKGSSAMGQLLKGGLQQGGLQNVSPPPTNLP